MCRWLRLETRWAFWEDARGWAMDEEGGMTLTSMPVGTISIRADEERVAPSWGA